MYKVKLGKGENLYIIWESCAGFLSSPPPNHQVPPRNHSPTTFNHTKPLLKKIEDIKDEKKMQTMSNLIFLGYVNK